MAVALDAHFPCSLTIDVCFPTERLAVASRNALQVDEELSPLVRRTFSTISARGLEEHDILRTEYKATTNRMLRVAVNGFMESLRLVLEIMEELDVDVLSDDKTAA